MGRLGIEHGSRRAARGGGQIGGRATFGAGRSWRCRDTCSTALAGAPAGGRLRFTATRRTAGRPGAALAGTETLGPAAVALFHAARGSLRAASIAGADGRRYRLDRQGGRQQPGNDSAKARDTVHGYPAKHSVPSLFSLLRTISPILASGKTVYRDGSGSAPVGVHALACQNTRHPPSKTR